MNRKNRLYRVKGFTLLEVLISVFLIMVGLGALGVSVVAGKRFLKQGDDRSRAMALAYSKMQEYAVKGYSELEGISSLIEDEEDGFKWQVSVNRLTAVGTTDATTYVIPYESITSNVSYEAEDGSGGVETRNIRLTNIVPYPKVHSTSIKLGVDSGSQQVPWVETDTSEKNLYSCSSSGSTCCQKDFPDSCSSSAGEDCSACAPFSNAKVVESGSELLEINDLEYSVYKNIQVIYSISVNVEETGTERIHPTDTIYTACFFDGKQEGLVTRTPIRTQPSFSNTIVIENAEKDIPHDISIRWYYNNRYYNEDDKKWVDEEYGSPNVTLNLNSASLAIIAVERKK